MIQMINVMTALGSELDEAGKMLRKPRRNGEADDAYRERLIDETPADGGAAFGELKQVGDCSIKTGGISVRDYFAAKAMQGAINSASLDALSEVCDTAEDMALHIAKAAYMQADAMLAERAK